MTMLIDPESHEESIRQAEALARAGVNDGGRRGVSCRMSLKCYRGIMSAIAEEVNRGTQPLEIIAGLELVIANAVATIVVNTNLGEAGAEDALKLFAVSIVEETMERFRRVRDGERGDLSTVVNTVEGGRA